MSQPVLGSSWTHRLARRAVRPLLGTWVRPNHLTTVRLLTGAGACAAFAVGTRRANRAGAALWLVSTFFDRADGELARSGNLQSPGGHLYDYWTDNAVNVGFFAAIGIGARRSALGRAAIPLGAVSAVSVAACNVLSERYERLSAPGTRAYAGRFGFDPDDALYLMAPLAWAGLLPAMVCASALGGSVVAAVTAARVRGLRARPTGAAAR